MGKKSAVVLAAGRSSRMGRSKPRLSLGTSTVLERVVEAFSQEAVEDVVVVTGHEPELLTAVLDTLPVRCVHNPDYDAGMFSSVLTGVTALPPDVGAFFIQPADLPLVKAQVLTRLLTAFALSDCDIMHPTCCGLRGHPPLLSGRCRSLLLQTPRDHDLGRFMAQHAAGSKEVEVEDLSVLMDMDTETDYRTVCRFADLDPEDSVSREDALYLLALLETPDRVYKHSLAVSAVGEALARALKSHKPSLDVELVSSAGLLHDLARTREDHAAVGANVLHNLGLHRLAAVVGAHMTMPPELLHASDLDEAHLVYLADKLVAGDQVVGLEKRAARTLSELGGSKADPLALRSMRARMAAAHTVQSKLEDTLGEPLKETLARAGLWA